MVKMRRPYRTQQLIFPSAALPFTRLIESGGEQPTKMGAWASSSSSSSSSSAAGVGFVVVLLLVLSLLAPSPAEAAGGPKSCPLTAAMKDFDLAKFTGDWYVLEYEYPKKMDLHALSCIGLHFSLTGFDSVMTNFTFRFPAKTGHFYHVPTISLVTEGERAVWETQFRGVNLVSLVIDTDYSNWAVLVQCHEGVSGEPAFLSTRLLSRTRKVEAGHWIKAEKSVERAKAAAPYRYPIDQKQCGELDGDQGEYA